MKTYEYTVCKMQEADLNEALTALGNSGWQLVTITHLPGEGLLAVCEREGGPDEKKRPEKARQDT